MFYFVMSMVSICYCYMKCPGDFFLIQEAVRLSFFSQPDGPIMGNGAFKTSVLVPGYVLWPNSSSL